MPQVSSALRYFFQELFTSENVFFNVHIRLLKQLHVSTGGLVSLKTMNFSFFIEVIYCGMWFSISCWWCEVVQISLSSTKVF